jgi:hypothetical protein
MLYILNCIQQIIIHIPDQNIPVPSPFGTIMITLKSFECVGIQIADIKSFLLQDQPTISFALDGIGTTCNGVWGVNWGIISGSGGVQAAISQTMLNISAALLSSDGVFATSAQAVRRMCFIWRLVACFDMVRPNNTHVFSCRGVVW